MYTITQNRFLMSGLFLVFIMSVIGGPVFAQEESYKSFYPHLVDLKGWKADEPDGAKLDVPGMAMTTAHRTYEKGNLEFEAMIMIGNPAMAAGMQTGVLVESPDIKVSFKEVNGFKVHISFDKGEHTGSVSVVLREGEKDGAYFILAFSNMNEAEGLKLAKEFDWGKMAKAVKKIK